MPLADRSASPLIARPVQPSGDRLVALRTALDLCDALVLVIDPADGRILEANRAAALALSDEDAPLEGTLLSELLADPRDAVRDRLLAGSCWAATMRRADGGPVVVHWQARPAEALDGRLVALAGRIVSPGSEAPWTAGLDPLTGLPDRRVFRQRVQRALARSHQEVGYHFAVLFVDLDDFKPVNDRFGHRAGDAVLAAVGERLRRTLRPTDLVARYGGDEFTLLVEGLQTPSDAKRVARRLLNQFLEPFEVEGQTLHVSGSVGVAVGKHARTPDDLIHAADQAMYRAKHRAPGHFAIASQPRFPREPR